MRVFVFGEAEKGDFCTPLRLQSLSDLSDRFGEPQTDSMGIAYAIQAILYERELIFYRIQEEGFSPKDYLQGVKLLYNHGKMMKISAICMPGVGDRNIIEAIAPFCLQHRIILILSQKDLFDYLTGSY